MKQITLNIPDSKFTFFMELIKSLSFVKVEEDQEPTKEEILANIKQGFKEMRLVEKGKLKSRPAKEFLNEL